jgi:hypothetical protein
MCNANDPNAATVSSRSAVDDQVDKRLRATAADIDDATLIEVIRAVGIDRTLAAAIIVESS